MGTKSKVEAPSSKETVGATFVCVPSLDFESGGTGSAGCAAAAGRTAAQHL